MRDERPEEFRDAIEFDAAIRKNWRTRDEAYLHRSLKPLSEVDLSTVRERGQGDLFAEECEGMCGV